MEDMKPTCAPLLDNDYDNTIKRVLSEFLLEDAKTAAARGDRGAQGVVIYATQGHLALTDETQRRMAAEWCFEEAEALDDADDEYYISRLGSRIMGFSDEDESNGYA